MLFYNYFNSMADGAMYARLIQGVFDAFWLRFLISHVSFFFFVIGQSRSSDSDAINITAIVGQKGRSVMNLPCPVCLPFSLLSPVRAHTHAHLILPSSYLQPTPER